MPGYRPPAGLAGEAVTRRGRVESFTHESPSLRDARRLHVYLPAGYDQEGGRRYPVAWLHDGTAYLEQVGVPAIADALLASDRIEPVIIVFVDPVVRRIDYSGNAAFRAMFTGELVPLIDGRYRTEERPERRLIAGGSRGGLAALDLALARPDLFGHCAAWAPAIAPTAVQAFLAGRSARGHFVLTRHLYDAEWGPDASALRDGLGAASVSYREIAEGHTLAAWPGRVADALVRVFPRP